MSGGSSLTNQITRTGQAKLGTFWLHEIQYLYRGTSSGGKAISSYGPPTNHRRPQIALLPRGRSARPQGAQARGGGHRYRDPEDLDSEVSRLTPQVVICSHATSAVRHIASSWIELYREHVDLLSYVSVGGEPPRVVDGMELADLLSIIDRALSLQPV
jgi:hypothetical protein